MANSRSFINAVWTAFWSILTFGLLKIFGKLRISKEEEIAGIDNYEHGGATYHIKILKWLIKKQKVKQKKN